MQYESDCVYKTNMSRSTWACELKYLIWIGLSNKESHAPRERVSWNCDTVKKMLSFISHAPRERVSWNLTKLFCLIRKCCHAPRERVSWNAEIYVVNQFTPWSRSTWACELKYQGHRTRYGGLPSRSTWACELKFAMAEQWGKIKGHAPRERVSWNLSHEERPCWHGQSRSTWACELK